MKKGFTIVELMASIVIIGVISLLGVATYRNVSERIKIQQYENKVSLIESKAALFASDTGYLRTNVNELICEGYLDYDEEADEKYTCGKIINPIDNTTLNEFIVDITREGENFYGNFTKVEQLDINEIDRENINMTISIKNIDGTEVDKWTNQNVNLTAKINEAISYENNNIKMVTWHNGAVLVKQCKFENGSSLNGSEAGCNDITSSFQHQVSAEQILNTNYRIEVTLSTEVEGTTIYQASKIVRIDKQKPIAYKNDIKVENANTWTNKNKATTIIGTDQNGSGIMGYYIGTSNICEENTLYEVCTDKNKKCNPEKYDFGAQGNGTYYVCAKDKAGNIGNATPFIIAKIDTEPPTCEITVNGSPNSNGWYNSAVTFNVTPSDSGGSGIKSVIKPEKLEDTNSDGVKIKAEVIDRAGNKGSCETTTPIKVDTKAPECTKGGDSTEWISSTRTIYYGCYDGESGSGCDPSYSGSSVPFTSTTKTSTIAAYTIKDLAGNTETCPARTANVYVDTTAPECTESGDSTTWINTTRTIYYGCYDREESGCDPSYSGSSVPFTSTTKTSEIAAYTIKDIAGNSKTCPKRTANVYVDTTDPSSCNISVSGTKNNGWYTTNVSFSASGSDADSKVASAIVDNTSLTTDSESFTVTATITDNAGNTKTCDKTVKRDATNPTVSKIFYRTSGPNARCQSEDAAGNKINGNYFGVTYSDNLSGVAKRTTKLDIVYFRPVGATQAGAGDDPRDFSPKKTIQDILCVPEGYIVSWWLNQDIIIEDAAGNKGRLRTTDEGASEGKPDNY